MEVCVLVKWSVIAKLPMVLRSSLMKDSSRHPMHTGFMCVIYVASSQLLTSEQILLNARDARIRHRYEFLCSLYISFIYFK